MFDFDVYLDGRPVVESPPYTDGQTVTVTVHPAANPHATSTGGPARITAARYAKQRRIPGVDGAEDTWGDPLTFEIDGTVATGPACIEDGHLYVQVVDENGRDAATWIQIPMIGEVEVQYR